MSDVNTTSNNLNNELINVSEWLKLNKLSLNINKTKCMLFHHANKVISRPVLKIDDTELEYVDNFCFLGIILDVNLSWKGHVDSISKKLAKIIGIMTKLKHFLPQPTLKIMYDSLIGSHLNYGIKCWGFNCKSLEKLQKKAVQVIANSKYNAHSEPLFKKLGILSIKDILKKKMYKFYFKLSNLNLPNYFMDSTWVVAQCQTHNYNTRNNNYKVPRIHHKFAENCLRYRLPILLNEGVVCITDKVNTHSESGFSIYIKKYLLSLYKLQCEIENCYICGNT
jgi:hypothetical protein